MTLDGFTLYFIVRELSALIGCRVDKVYQPRPDTVIIAMRPSFNAGAENARLLVCAGASDSRMHLTARKYQNPKSPPAFCMFLRKYLTGAKITGVAQHGLERVVDITFESRDELGLCRELVLTCELMGKYSNIILRNENGVIMDCLRHVTPVQSRVRSVLPSLPYVLPESSKLDPLAASAEELIGLLRGRDGRNLKAFLPAALQGVSSQTAEEIICRLPSGARDEEAAAVIKEFFSSEPKPVLYSAADGTPFFFSPFAFASISAPRAEFPESVNALADEYYARSGEKRAFESKRESLRKSISKRLEKLYAQLQKQRDALEESKKAGAFKNAGDIITANIYRIAKGSSLLLAEDFVTGEPVEIRLDPRLSPSANAQAFYKKYSKLRSGIEITANRMLETQKEIDFLESVQVSLDLCETSGELSEIEYEIGAKGARPKGAGGRAGADKPSSPHRFVSSDGCVFYAGKNNRQNDILTMKTASPGDIWLHAKNIPGSHVVITGLKGAVPDRTLFEAATVAATLSKARASSKVSVDYTQKKNVRKPPGSKPGMVVYDRYETVVVNPDAELLKRLLSE